VRVPKSSLVAGPDAYEAMLENHPFSHDSPLWEYSVPAWPEQLSRSPDLRQEADPGRPASDESQNVQAKLFHMFSKVELSRQISRSAYIFNQNTSTPAEEYSLIAKVFGTQSAFEVANDAVQLFGGNGLTKEYLVEKLFRDARATLIEDGSNDVLAIAGGHKMIRHYPRLD